MLARRPYCRGWMARRGRQGGQAAAGHSARGTARRILDAIAAEKLAKVRLFEEGIREQMRLHERLLADRAECLEKLARAEADIERVRAERDAAAAAVDKRTRKRAERRRPRRPRRLRRKGEKARGAGGGGGGARPPPPPPPATAFCAFRLPPSAGGQIQICALAGITVTAQHRLAPPPALRARQYGRGYRAAAAPAAPALGG